MVREEHVQKQREMAKYRIAPRRKIFADQPLADKKFRGSKIPVSHAHLGGRVRTLTFYCPYSNCSLPHLTILLCFIH